MDVVLVVSRGAPMKPVHEQVAPPDADSRQRDLALPEATMFEPGTMKAAHRFDTDAALRALRPPVRLMSSDNDWNVPLRVTLEAAPPHAVGQRLPGVHPPHVLGPTDRSVE